MRGEEFLDGRIVVCMRRGVGAEGRSGRERGFGLTRDS